MNQWHTKVGGKGGCVRNNESDVVRPVESVCKRLQNVRATHNGVLDNLRDYKLAVLQLVSVAEK
jgi:hypothetical protein